MTRDMDLNRRLLQEIEAAPFDGGAVSLDLPEVPKAVVQYHLLLLAEAGLIEALDASTMGGPRYIPKRLTWSGHEFLEASRNENIWKNAKATVLARTGGLGFEVLLAVLKEGAKRAVLGSD